MNQAADADNTKSTVYFNTENKQNEVLLLINLVIKLKKFLHKKQLKKNNDSMCDGESSESDEINGTSR